MMNVLKFFSFLTLIFLLPFAIQAQATIDTAVNFNVKTYDGKTINLFKLLDEENKIVVIDFFSVTCGPCQEYAPDFQGSYLDFGENNGNVFHIGINWGATNDQVEYFINSFGLTYPVVSGNQGGGNSVYTDYGIMAYPTVVIIDPETHLLARKNIKPPTQDSINNAIIKAGGIMVGLNETKENIENSIKLYPNPARSTVNIKINKSVHSLYKIFIINLLGKVIYSHNGIIEKNNLILPINLSNFPSGVFFVKIEINNQIFTKKLIIK
jgi:thiol-disulfide isomerase/thioredoxin